MPWILLTDGDRQFDLSELVDLLPLAAGHDLVAGYRVDRQDGLARRTAGRAWSWLTRRTFGFGVMDVDCAFELIRTSSVRRVELTSDGAILSAELLPAASATDGASRDGRPPPPAGGRRADRWRPRRSWPVRSASAARSSGSSGGAKDRAAPHRRAVSSSLTRVPRRAGRAAAAPRPREHGRRPVYEARSARWAGRGTRS